MEREAVLTLLLSPTIGQLAMSGDIFVVATGIYRVEARKAAKYPKTHRTAPIEIICFKLSTIVLRLSNPDLKG